MASTKGRITQRSVAALQPNSVLWDVALAGFGVRRQRGDARTFFVKYRADGRQRWLTMARIRANSGTDFVAHDLRRTAASRMTGDLGISRLTVSKILNHVESGVTAIYDRHSYDGEKKQALNAWGQRLTAESSPVPLATPACTRPLPGPWPR